jgi:hypothetical protein
VGVDAIAAKEYNLPMATYLEVEHKAVVGSSFGIL